jgi:hypothetical protein
MSEKFLKFSTLWESEDGCRGFRPGETGLGIWDLRRDDVAGDLENCEDFPLEIGVLLLFSAGDGERGTNLACDCCFVVGETVSEREVPDTSLRVFEDAMCSFR